MHEFDNAWAKLPLQEQARMLSHFGAWVNGLRDSGAFVTGRPCGGECRLILGGGSSDVTDITIQTEGLSDVVTGFFVIRANDMDSAIEIAKTCPALLHG
jgi:hypothetical protein